MPSESTAFSWLGAVVARNPKLFILLSVVLFLPPFYGLFRVELRLGLDSDFTRLDAPSRNEVAVQREFFHSNTSASPWYLAIFGVPRHHAGNMLDAGEFQELNDMAEFISRNATFGPSLTFQNVCHPFCDINGLLVKVMTAPPFLIYPRYPVYDVWAYKVNVGKYIFKRNVSESGQLLGSKLMVFYYTVLIDTPQQAEYLRELDRKVARAVSEHNANPNAKIDIVLHGTRPVEDEIRGGAEKCYRLIALGLVLAVLAFVLTCSLGAAVIGHTMCLALGWAFLAILLTVLSVVAGVGAIGLMGLAVGTPFAISPLVGIAFLLNAIVLYQIFDSWLQISAGLAKNAPVAPESPGKALCRTSSYLRPGKDECLGLLFDRLSFVVLPSLAVVAVGLPVAAFFAVPQFRAVLLAFSVTCVYQTIFQLFVTCPVIVLTAPKAAMATKQSTASRVSNRATGENFKPLRVIKTAVSSRFTDPYARFLDSAVGKAIVGCFFVLGVLLPVLYGLHHRSNSMDLKKLLPEHSPSIRAFQFMENHVWHDFHQVMFIVNRPPDFTRSDEFLPFREMISELESFPDALGPETNLMWLIDYLNDKFDVDYHKEHLPAINMSAFERFISDEPYSAWQDGVRYHIDQKTKKVTIDKMLVMVTYGGFTTLEGKVSLLTRCREILRKYPRFETVAFDTDSETVDMILAVPENVLRPAVIIVLGTAVLAFILGHNFASACVVAAFSVVNALALYGFIFFFDIHLDIFIVPTLVFCQLIGNTLILTAVNEYAAHVEDKQRLRATLQRLCCLAARLVPLALLLTLPVLATPVPIYRINALIVLIATVVGVVQATVLVPALLVALPLSSTGRAYFCSGKRDDV